MKIIYKSFLCLLLFSFLIACKKKDEREVPTGTVIKGALYLDLYEEGEIEAINSIGLSSPTISWRYGNLKISQIVKDGSEVKKGDTLIIFDPSEVNKAIIDAEGALEIAKAEFEKLKASQQMELEELNADLEVTQLSYEISKIKFEASSYKSDIEKKEMQLNLEKADISLKKAKEQIANKIKIQREDIKQKNVSISQNQARLDEANETLKKLFIITPSPGIAILERSWSTGNKYQIGDQCWSGTPLIQLPDLSTLKATVNINEVDISKIQKGLKVEIKPDAFSDSIFTGTINSVANLAVNKKGSTRIKVFPVEIVLDKAHKNLLPGLTVSCRIIMDKIDNVLYLPLDAVINEGDKSFVYKKSGSSYNKVEVKTGISNSDFIIITEGLKEGEKVALTDPFAVEETVSEEKTGEEE